MVAVRHQLLNLQLHTSTALYWSSRGTMPLIYAVLAKADQISIDMPEAQFRGMLFLDVLHDSASRTVVDVRPVTPSKRADAPPGSPSSYKEESLTENDRFRRAASLNLCKQGRSSICGAALTFSLNDHPREHTRMRQ
jgi:hypothetical protein